MSHNTFGHLFRVTTFGESHGPAIGCVVDGCPPLIPLEAADIQADLDRRRPGTSRFTTQRREPDEARILSGVMTDDERPAGDDRRADRADDRERRPALEGLCRDQGQIPPRPCRLHLRGQIRHPRLSRRRPLLGARDGGAGRRRRDRAQGRSGRARSAARWCRSASSTIDRARWDWDEVGRNPFFCPDAGRGRAFRRLSRRRAQGRLVDRRGDRDRRRGRAGRLGRADLRQARHARSPRR